MASDFAFLAVSFVYYRTDLVESQRGLRYQLSVLAHPRPVRHINLEPVGAVRDLLARDLTHLHCAIAKLRSFWDDDVRVVALKWVSARHRDCARDHEQSRAGDVAVVNRLFDPEVAVAGAFSLHVAQSCEAFFQRPMHRDNGAGSAIRRGVFQQLHVVTALGGIFALKKHVRVSINEAGQNGAATSQVDDFSVRWRGATLADALDLVPADDDHHVVAGLCRGSIDESRRPDGDRFFWGRGFLSEAESGKQKHDEENGSTMHLVLHLAPIRNTPCRESLQAPQVSATLLRQETEGVTKKIPYS